LSGNKRPPVTAAWRLQGFIRYKRASKDTHHALKDVRADRTFGIGHLWSSDLFAVLFCSLLSHFKATVLDFIQSLRSPIP
jgi:hypothetical protein